MARFDRRKTYPLYPAAENLKGLVTDIVTYKAIVPTKVGGIIKARGSNLIPINRAAVELEHPYLYKIPFTRFTSGGASDQYGARKVYGGGGGAPPGLSPEAQAVIDRMPDPLSDIELNAISAYVDAEVAVGNWEQFDEFFCFALTGANKSQGWVAKTGTPVGTLDVPGGFTFQGGGASYFDTNWNVADDSVNMTLESGQIGCFYFEPIVDIGQYAMMGVNETSQTRSTRILNTFLLDGDIDAYFNGAGSSSVNKSFEAFGQGLYDSVRTASNSLQAYVDGSPDGSVNAGVISGAFPSFNMYIGAQNTENVGAELGVIGTISLGYMGGVLPDQATHYTNVIQLLTDLGVL